TFFKKCADHFLEEKLHLLNEVVIKEYISSGVSLKNDGTIHFDLKKADILAGQAEPDVLQSVQLLPSVESPTENATDLFIRGSSPDQNLILWDGIKLYNTDHFFGTSTNLNTSLINDISIYKSGVSAQYGDRASGVIDIALDKEVPKEIEASLGFNFLHSDFSLKIPVSKKIGFVASTRRSIIDFITSDIFNNNFTRIFQNSRITQNRLFFSQVPNTEQEQNLVYEDHSVKIIYDISKKHTFTSTFLYTNNEFKDRYNAVIAEVEDQILVKESFFDELKIENLGVNTSFNSTWNNSLSTNINLSYSNYDLDYQSFSFNPLFFSSLSLIRFNSIKEHTLNTSINYQLPKHILLSTGYELSSKQVKTGVLDAIFDDIISNNKNKPDHAIYGQLSYNILNNIHIDVGLRCNKFANFDRIKLEPRFYAEKKIGNNLRLNASAEIRNQSLNRNQILSGNDTGEENEIWQISTQDGIPLLNSKQLSFGGLLKYNSWIIDVDFYYKKLKGLTAFSPLAFNLGVGGALESLHTGTGDIKGLDLLIKKKIANYVTWFGYTYAKNEQQFDEINDGEPFKASNDITHSFTWSNFYKWKNFQFSLGWKYRLGIPFILIKDFDGIDPIIESFNKERLPNYHRLDFSVTYKIGLSKFNKTKNAQLGLSILNLYNRKNILNRSFTNVTIESAQNLERTLSEINSESLGITPNLFVRFNF
ncbi:TonB-dependent receptor plug domain-containing protein, partial [Aquimarina agarilytica]|uniref:TonB-dependent receptor plug domain-containing protein n=1 Tax=Aquimarina agarilytica TaxID=1087449 RepID=UPI000289AC7A